MLNLIGRTFIVALATMVGLLFALPAMAVLSGLYAGIMLVRPFVKGH